MVCKPSFCQFAGMTGCTVMLKHDFRPLLLHLVIESIKVGLQDLGNIPWSSHTSTSSSWVFQHDKRALPAFHDASPDHYSNRRLLECWYDTVFIIFFISTTCDKNAATVVIKMNIAFIRPYEVPPLISAKALVFLCPCNSLLLLECGEEWHFPCNTSVVSCSCSCIMNNVLGDTHIGILCNVLNRLPTFLNSVLCH